MLFGVFRQQNQGEISRDAFNVAASELKVKGGHELKVVYPDPAVAFGYRSPFRTADCQNLAPICSNEGDIAVVFSGQVYNKNELAKTVGINQSEITNLSTLIMKLYQMFGVEFVERLNGKFAYAIWDKAQQRTVLGRDRLGIEPLYYHLDKKALIFSSSIAPILKYSSALGELNYSSVSKFLLFGYNPGQDTFYSGIRKLQPAQFLNVQADMSSRMHRYWELKYDNILRSDETTIADELKDKLQKSVETRMEMAVIMVCSSVEEWTQVVCLAFQHV